MTDAGIVVIVLLAIIFMGYKKWVNIVPMAAAAALVLGALNGIKADDVLRLLPVSAMFDMFILTFFFGFAVENGTFSALIDRVLYRTRKHTRLAMPLIYGLSFCLALMGLGIMTAAFIAPLAYRLADKLKLPAILAYASALLGCIFGSNFPLSMGGTVVYNLVRAGESGAAAERVVLHGFLWTGLITTAAFLLIYLGCKGWRVPEIEQPDPAALTQVQKKTVAVIVGVFSAAVVVSILQGCLAGTRLSGALPDTGLVMAVGCCISSVLKLSDDHRVLKEHVPWQMLCLIGVMGMLIGIGKQVGMLDTISDLMKGSVPAVWIAPLLALVAGLMSVFTSAIGVVIPTLYALVPGLALAYGISPVPLLVAPFVAATITGCSPLSTTGGMALSVCPDAEMREKLFYQAIPLPFSLLAAVVILARIAG